METVQSYVHTYVIIFTLQDPELQRLALYPQNGLQWTALPPPAVSLFLHLNAYMHVLCLWDDFWSLRFLSLYF